MNEGFAWTRRPSRVPAGAWRKSSACHANNACVEVARVWRTASFSVTADCVAVAVIEED